MGIEPQEPSSSLPTFPLAGTSQFSAPAAHTLPPQPSLEQLKKQAKDLLAAVRSGDRAAQERLEHYFPRLGIGQEATPQAQCVHYPTLARAQLVIAREHGFASWARLRRAVELAPLRALLEQCIERPIDWPARRNAMGALAAAGPWGMLVTLEALSNPDPELRAAALRVIDHQANDACVPQLARVAQTDPDPTVRRLAVHALICERCKPTPLQLDPLPVLLESFRRDPNRRVRFSAAQSMRPYLDNPMVQEGLRAAACGDPSSLVRRAAVDRLRGGESEPLLAHVAQHDPDPHVRVAAARRLGREPYVQLACQVLEAALREGTKPQVKHDAHHALKRLSPEYRQLAAQRAREANLAGTGTPQYQWRKRQPEAAMIAERERVGSERLST